MRRRLFRGLNRFVLNMAISSCSMFSYPRYCVRVWKVYFLTPWYLRSIFLLCADYFWNIVCDRLARGEFRILDMAAAMQARGTRRFWRQNVGCSPVAGVGLVGRHSSCPFFRGRHVSEHNCGAEPVCRALELLAFAISPGILDREGMPPPY
jgi:hypothetical protein